MASNIELPEDRSYCLLLSEFLNLILNLIAQDVRFIANMIIVFWKCNHPIRSSLLFQRDAGLIGPRRFLDNRVISAEIHLRVPKKTRHLSSQLVRFKMPRIFFR